ncbi:hypothetical protein [Streptomyces europaeiscabiei]|uniref:hypothetical protein n=1 Tax=Streptomyces europaeiscabiei TaxID=146819 RepID=UPI002E101446|nr:hypothetical protein OHB30_08755 [Streptomyces europaeiscabiei]
MVSILANVAIGLLTSLVGLGLGALWERGRRTREQYRRAAFFGTRPGEHCVIVVGAKHGQPGMTHQKDLRAVVELTVLLSELDCRVSVESADLRGSNGDRTEFCVGGPIGGSNPRTGGHLTAYLPGVTITPFSDRPDSVAIVVGGERYYFDRGHQEYAVVAKFTPPESSRPVVLVCGQSAVANQAAVHFMRREYEQVARSVASLDQYCLLVKVSHIDVYSFHRSVLERDVSAEAFAVVG